MSERPATGDWPATSHVAADWPRLPGYAIQAELGRGGMGVVYRARHLSSQRPVALKLLRDAALAGPEERARFRIEAEAAARMRHPNIVDIYELGEHEGLPYFAMELVEGGNLEQLLAGRPLPATQAAELLRTLALAVQHAHAQHIVHRDLKPANVLLQIADCRFETADLNCKSAVSNLQSAIPKIADFGLAKRLDSESTAWTQAGAVLGTASYMSPEQASGRANEVGPAADVYGLGAILYQLLTGRAPFQADSWHETLRQVVHDEPTPPAQLRPDVPPELETICLQCLEKEPARRYPSAGELAEDLGRHLERRPIRAVPLDARERLARLAERDGYRILEEIGRGPRGTVYHALYGPLQQPVALKVFRTGTATPAEWEAHLRRVAEVWATLAHPHLVPVHRGGWWNGAAYLALEYVPQGSLADRIAGRPYPVPDAIRLVEQVAEVVCYLHRQGVVHGNLKPSNVLLAADNIPRIVDLAPAGGFLAGPLSDEAPVGVTYRTPEQVHDPAAEPRPYTDVYGLGLILYELLTGRPPFACASAEEAREQVRTQNPAAPSRLNAGVSNGLDAVCLRSLRKSPYQRYHRAYDFLSHLRAYTEELPDRGRRRGAP